MTHLSYLIAGWSIALGIIAVYAVSLLRRGKAVAATVPVERRRWMTTDD